MKGDQADQFARLQSLLPPWFGASDESPAVNAVLQGAAWALAFVYGLYAFALTQIRIATASGGWLDLIAVDYFGDDLRRFGSESDANYSRRIRLEILRQRNTRAGIDRAVFDLTANHPDIYEAFRPASCACLGTLGFALGAVGLLGSSGAPLEVIVATPAPTGYGVPNRPGWNDTLNGIQDTFSLSGDGDVVANGPTFTDVIKALERVRSAGVAYYIYFT